MSVRPRRRRKADPDGPEAGGVAVEFAIVLPIFLSILFGMIGFGLYLSTALALESAAHAGARASVGGLNGAGRADLAEARIRDAIGIYGGLAADAQFANCTDPAANVVCVAMTDDSPPGHFRVRIAYRFGLSEIVPFVPIPVTIVREAVVAHGGF